MNSLKFNDVCNFKIQLNHVLPSVVNLKSHKRGFVNSDYIYVTKTYTTGQTERNGWADVWSRLKW